MTKGEAITEIYALFNAPHNADINLVYLNKVLDDLCNSHPESMHPEIKKIYEDYFDKCFRESSSAVPENFIDALRFDVAVRDAREWEKVDMREHAEGNLGIGTAPPPQQRTWVGLTFDEKNNARYITDWKTDYMAAVIEYIEAKLKEKNNG